MAQFADRQGVLEWLEAHVRERVRLRDGESTLRVVGRTAAVESLDACSTEYKSVHLDVGQPGISVDVTLLDDALALLVRLEPPAGGASALVLPYSLPYARVRLSRADDPDANDAESPADEPAFSPYELLHRGRSD